MASMILFSQLVGGPNICPPIHVGKLQFNNHHFIDKIRPWFERVVYGKITKFRAIGKNKKFIGSTTDLSASVIIATHEQLSSLLCI